MNEEMRIKYYFVDMKYSLYIQFQGAFVIALLIGAILCFFLTQDSDNWFLKNGWWLLSIFAVLEVGEAYIAIKKSKKEFNAQQSTDSA